MSGYHSAVNFPQATSYAYMPFRPSGMRRIMPRLSNFATALKDEKKTYVFDGDVSSRFI